MPMAGVWFIVWLIFVTFFLVGWARIHAIYRAMNGIDEDQYVNGLDERSMSEAA
jgi:hypothetical protein